MQGSRTKTQTDHHGRFFRQFPGGLDREQNKDDASDSAMRGCSRMFSTVSSFFSGPLPCECFQELLPVFSCGRHVFWLLIDLTMGCVVAHLAKQAEPVQVRLSSVHPTRVSEELKPPPQEKQKRSTEPSIVPKAALPLSANPHGHQGSPSDNRRSRRSSITQSPQNPPRSRRCAHRDVWTARDSRTSFSSFRPARPPERQFSP